MMDLTSSSCRYAVAMASNALLVTFRPSLATSAGSGGSCFDPGLAGFGSEAPLHGKVATRSQRIYGSWEGGSKAAAIHAIESTLELVSWPGGRVEARTSSCVKL